MRTTEIDITERNHVDMFASIVSALFAARHNNLEPTKITMTESQHQILRAEPKLTPHWILSEHSETFMGMMVEVRG